MKPIKWMMRQRVGEVVQEHTFWLDADTEAGRMIVSVLETMVRNEWTPVGPVPEAPQPRPFDLEAAKRGEPIEFEDGTPAYFVAHVPEMPECCRVLVRQGEPPHANIRYRKEDGSNNWESEGLRMRAKVDEYTGTAPPAPEPRDQRDKFERGQADGLEIWLLSTAREPERVDILAGPPYSSCGIVKIPSLGSNFFYDRATGGVGAYGVLELRDPSEQAPMPPIDDKFLKAKREGHRVYMRRPLMVPCNVALLDVHPQATDRMGCLQIIGNTGVYLYDRETGSVGGLGTLCISPKDAPPPWPL